VNTALTPIEKAKTLLAWCGDHSEQSVYAWSLFEGVVGGQPLEEFSLHTTKSPEVLELKSNGVVRETIDFLFWDIMVSDDGKALMLIAHPGHLPELRFGIFVYCYKFVMAR